jgi:hypothetical protein
VVLLQARPDTSAGRLVVHDQGTATGDPGCDVMLRNSRTQETREISAVFGQKTFQLADAQHWKATASYSGCETRILAGAGTTPLPVLHLSGLGDSPAFAAIGPIRVEITDIAGNSGCRLVLHSVKDGKALDDETVNGAGSTTLDPRGESPVYIADPLCGLRITQK